jgi:peptidoglycan hydrolase CwlO-like protein
MEEAQEVLAMKVESLHRTITMHLLNIAELKTKIEEAEEVIAKHKETIRALNEARVKLGV